MLDNKIAMSDDDDLNALMKHTMNYVQLEMHDRAIEALTVINERIGAERV